MRIFKSNIIAVLLYGHETRRMTKADANSLDTFLHKCIGKNLKVHWPMRVSNDEIRRRGGIEMISIQVTQKMEMNRSRSTYGTKPKPARGTDLGTKWEKEAETAEGYMEEDGGKGTR